MTKDEFFFLQAQQSISGLSLLKFLKQEQVSYSTYNYWKRKFSTSLERAPEGSESTLAPISIKEFPVVAVSSVCGITLLFPNGVRAHLSFGMEDSTSRLINQYSGCHVLSE